MGFFSHKIFKLTYCLVDNLICHFNFSFQNYSSIHCLKNTNGRFIFWKGELAQVPTRPIKTWRSKPIVDELRLKKIALINVLMNNLKHRQSLNNEFIRPTEEFGQPILIPKTDAVDCFFPACRGSLISITDQGRKTTVTIAITTNQQRNSSQSKTANNTKTYVYIGVGAGALLVGTGGAISLIKWIHKKKSQQRVIDVYSS